MKDKNTTDDEKRPLTPEELDSIMPEGNMVHTYIRGGIMIIGADVARSKILEDAKKHGAELAGEQATAMNHGAAIFDEEGKATFVATDPEALKTLEAKTA